MTLAGSVDAAWYERPTGDSWVEAGSHFKVCRSEQEVAPGSGQAQADAEAVAVAALERAREEAIEQAYGFGFERLHARGLLYEREQRRAMIREKAAAMSGGLDVSFPRIEIADEVHEECSCAAGETLLYRVSLLTEYPISSLKGDLNNATWRAGRVANEASVLVGSARELLAEGRWFEALTELSHARRLLAGVSPLPGVLAVRERVGEHMDRAVGSLEAEALAGIQVLTIGERRETAVSFRWTYEWEGERRPAVRLPVAFEPRGFDAVTWNDPETDESGIASCRFVVAFGPAGEHELVWGADASVLSRVLGRDYAARLSEQERHSHPVFLADRLPALSVCMELQGLNAADEAQLMAALESRLKDGGLRVEPCGPDVDLVVRAEVEKRRPEAQPGQTMTAVRLWATAFDQRSATDIGSPSVLVRETAEDERDSEVLALKEAGRLLAVYLSRRSRLSGG
ncbi:MAG: hypothetical protein GF400_03130 [Candidatus Eisenbacteria bacterium]|nr:hypothetical protein [Candidatus Eisenbacteria bacterium]